MWSCLSLRGIGSCMRKISEMYRLSGGTVPGRICRDCGNCRKEKNGYRCRLYEEGGGNGAWKEYFVACRFFNLPHLPESMRKPEEQPEIPRGEGTQMSFRDFPEIMP